MINQIPTPVRCLPLCSLLFLAAADGGCIIRIDVEDDDEDEEECPSRQDLCPELRCDFYVVGDDGCTQCECAGEGEGEGECQSDQDCGPGLVCEFLERCGCAEPTNNGQDEACFCDVVGLCVDPNPAGCAAALCAPGTTCVEDEQGNARCIPDDDLYCQTDSDCREDERCNLDYCINPSCDANTPCPPVCTHGLCEPALPPGQCYSDADCDEGFFCEYNGGGAAPPCDPSSNNGCNGEDFVAMFGVCVERDPNQCPALCGPGHECVVSSDGEVRCVPVGPAECRSDQDCASGETCNAADVCLSDPACQNGGICPDVCWGYCVPPAPASCQSDADCAQGEVCELRDTCAAIWCDPNTPCDVPCYVEGVCVAR